MADILKNEFDLDEVALISGRRGEFTIWLDETLLAEKDYFGFPSEEDVVRALKAVLA